MSDIKEKDEHGPKPGDPCVECGTSDGTQPADDSHLVPDGKNVSMCPRCREDRAAWWRKNGKVKPLPSSPNRRCC